jgi:hypothetical protein
LATPAVVNGNTLSFIPVPYPFMPGETVQLTVTRAAASSGGALASARVQQFTTATGGTGRGFFGSDIEVAVGNSPEDVALGDLDGDGDLDFVAANFAPAGTVSVRLNSGTGIFTNGQELPISSNNGPRRLALGDVDGDGDLDLLAAVPLSGAVFVRLNNGAGTFSGSQNVVIPSSPEDVALGDLDGDGDLDFVTANIGAGSTASVRFNNGAGLFSGSQNVAIGNFPRSVALGDVDGDADLDLLITNYSSNEVRVYRNDGTGTFGSSQSVPLTSNTEELALADVDADGDLDLVVALPSVNTVSIQLNDGAGTFSSGQVVVLGTSSNLLSLTMGDVDADGDLDLLIANSVASTANVLLNNGAGNFSSGPSVMVGNNPVSITVGDIDGDGDLDLLTSNRNQPGNTVSVRLNNAAAPLATLTGAAHLPMMLYPNPAHGSFRVTGLPAHAVVEVFDVVGRPVARIVASTNTTQIELPAGWYLVRSGSQVQRLVME